MTMNPVFSRSQPMRLASTTTAKAKETATVANAAVRKILVIITRNSTIFRDNRQ